MVKLVLGRIGAIQEWSRLLRIGLELVMRGQNYSEWGMNRSEEVRLVT